MTGLGLNTYCLRAFRWNDAQLLDYTASLKLDAVFLQDSLDPRAMDPAHWPEVGEQAAKLQLHLETGGIVITPKTPSDFDNVIAALRKNIQRAQAMGSPLVRCITAGDRTAILLPVERHIETVVKVLRTVKPQVVDANLKIAIEIHKDLQAWEHKIIIDEAGRDFVGTYLDTGNPVFVMEDPMTTVEILGSYALTFHLRDSVVYEHKRGIAVQWVPLGQGNIDFPAIVAKMNQLAPNVYAYVKPITGRPPAILPIYDEKFWSIYPKARANELSRFLALAKSGAPYERPMVIEDVPGAPAPPEPYRAALQYQQKDHMEISVEYAKKKLDLGVRWRH